MSNTCTPYHDWFTATLTFGLCCGLIISYVPQHYRIIHKGSSEGFSPWFLLLGSTASAAGFLNMVTMQWRIVKCCKILSMGTCVEMTAGIVSVGLQWLMFTIILVLYMIYYPQHLKHQYTATDSTLEEDVAYDTHDSRPLLTGTSKPKVTLSSEWRLSITLAWVVAVHLLFVMITTFYLLASIPTPPSSNPSAPLPHAISSWATFLGVSSAMLSAIQYAPQLVHTYRMKVVGALSIPMMCMQSPGAAIMVLSIALRPGTNWTSWIMFAVSGIMQGGLLIMCILWTFRQRRLGIDEFGNPLPLSQSTSDLTTDAGDGGVPGLVADEDDDPAKMRVALEAALESAVGADVRDEHVVEEEVGEDTPLLVPTSSSKQAHGGGGWLGWLTRL